MINQARNQKRLGRRRSQGNLATAEKIESESDENANELKLKVKDFVKTDAQPFLDQKREESIPFQAQERVKKAKYRK